MAIAAKDLLSSKVVVARPEERLRDVAPALLLAKAQLCAVVDHETGLFSGLVRLADAAAFSTSGMRILADLVGEERHRRVPADAPAEAVLSVLAEDRDSVIVVTASDGRYCGLVTQDSTWEWLMESNATQQRRVEKMLEEQRRLGDLLERKVEQRTASLRAALKEFREASIMLSHDVGGPLRSIKSFADMLLEGECGVLNAEGIQQVARIQRSATNLEILAADILGRAREAGKAVPSNFDAVDLNEVLQDACELAQATLRERSATVVQKKTLHVVSGRYVPLLQIVSNLLANAVKYVPSGRTPAVEIWSEETGGRIVLCVKDNGCGIAAADKAAIFEPFVRLDGVRSPGTGLGLHIARNAVRGLGGDIQIESEVDVGSVFTVWLNRAGTPAGF